MNPRLRVVLTLLPVLSIGLLNWLPFLWLSLSRPKGESSYTRNAWCSVVGTFACAAGLLFIERDSPVAALFGLLYLFHMIVAMLIVWVYCTRLLNPAKDPVKDPYA